MITSKNIHSEVKNRLDMNIVHLVSSTMPISGGDGSGASFAGPGSTCVDNSTGIVYVNENTAALPVWTPITFDQPNLMGYRWGATGVTPKAASNTAATLTAAPGIRVFGEGITETDSGVTLGTTVEGSHVAGLITTDEAAHNACIGYQDATVAWQPDTHGGMVIDAIISMESAITLRQMFIGFLGTAADALATPATGSTTTITLVQDDMVGMMMDVGLTDSDGIFACHNKSNAAANQATTDTGIDLSTTLAAAATYQRFRVEVSADGDTRFLIDNALVGSRIAIALDVDEEVTPVFLLGSTSAATKQVNIKQIMMWISRGTL